MPKLLIDSLTTTNFLLVFITFNSRNVKGDVDLSVICDLFDGNGPFGGQFCEDEEFSFALDTVDLSEWGNTGMSAKFIHRWIDRLDTNFVLSSSEYFSYRDRLINSQVVYDESIEVNEDNQLKDKMITLSFGLQLNQQEIDFSLIQNDDLILETNNEAITSTIYLEDEIILDRLTIVQYQRNHSVNDEIYPEPRLSVTYELGNSTQFRAAFGDYHQFALSISRQSIQEGPRNFWTLADGETVPVSLDFIISQLNW